MFRDCLPSLNSPTRPRLTLVAAVLFGASTILGGVGPASMTFAAEQDGGSRGQVLIGRDDDNLNNPIIQPPNTAANQSLNNTDVQLGGSGNDVIIGLLGGDVQLGGSGDDIIVGGPDPGAPNSDVIFGDSGADVSLWAPGDGSDAFIGGSGLDAEVFGVTDRTNGVPTLSAAFPGFPQGIPTANVTGMGGFCTIEKVSDPALGYEFLARFFVRATGALAVTIRLTDVEQVFCNSQAGGTITFADLKQDNPQFVEVSLDRVRQLNRTVSRMIR
jgi:hypothetical protein